MPSFLSIEIGKRQVKVLLLDREKDTLVVRQDLNMIIPPEFVKSKIPETLKEFIRKYDVTDRKVYLSISDPNEINLRNAVFPLMPPAELVQAISWHAKEEGALTEETVFFNYDIAKEFEDPDGAKKVAVTYSIVNKKLLNNSIQMLNRIGLEVLHVSATLLDLPKLLSAQGLDQQSQMVLHLGYSSTTCVIYRKGKLIFVRQLSFSFEKARLSLNDPLFLGPKYKTPEAEGEINQAIASTVIPTDDLSVGSGENRVTQFFGLLRPVLEGLVREIRYTTNYFTNTASEEKPTAITLTGHGTVFRGLDAYLNKELQTPVSYLSLPKTVRCEQKAITEDPVRLSQCVSVLAGQLPGEKGADFMPFELRKQKFETFQRSVLKVVTVVAVGICVISFALANLRVMIFKERLSFAKKELVSFGKFSQASSQAFSKYYLARELEKATIPPDKALRLAAHLLPGGLAMREFSVDSDTRTMIADLETSGLDEGGNPMVEDFLERLRDSGFFERVDAKSVPGYAVSVYRVEGVFKHD